MSDVAPVVPVAPTNGAHPTTPQKPAAVKPVDAKPLESKKPEEVDDSEEYVVDGKTVRWTKAQRQINFQKAIAADKRLKEAADEKNKAAELLKLWETDPDAAARKLGRDPDKDRAAHLEKRAKLELMTEEQRRISALESERDEHKAKAEKFEKEQQAAKQAEVDQRNFKALETQLISAADTHGLDGTPETLEGLCDIALEYIDYGVVLTAEQVAQEYIRRDQEHVEAKDKKLLGFLKGEKLLKYLGPAAIAEVKAALAQLDTDSLKDIPKPKSKVPVKAHERTIKGAHISELEFDKAFKL